MMDNEGGSEVESKPVVDTESHPPDEKPASTQDGDDAPKPTVAKAKKTYAKRKGRKAVKKKPGDMPRRPLSAYNYFFSEMRTKLLADRASGTDTVFQEFLNEKEKADGTKKHGFFSNMGKFVAKRWKELTPEELQPYSKMADEDLKRYRREMDEYREGVARKTRLASEQKLREQDVEVAQAPQANAMIPTQGFPGQGFMMGQIPPFMQGVDPSLQFLLRQQMLSAQNPQLNALFLQQQLGAGPQGMPGFPGAQMFPQQQQPDMSGMQNFGQNQELLNSMQQQGRMAGGMFPQAPQQPQPPATTGGPPHNNGDGSQPNPEGQFMMPQQPPQAMPSDQGAEAGAVREAFL